MADNIDGIAGLVDDPKLRRLLDRTVKEFELAVEKVAANHAEPTAFPLPTGGGTTERILAARFGKLPADTRKAAATTVAHRLAGPQQTVTADLGAVDLRKPTAIEQQVSALPLPAGLAFKLPVPAAPVVAAAAAAPASLRKLELRIHKVRCDDETNGFLGSEAGSDEIDLGGTTVDESGDTGVVKPFRVRSFGKDGDVQVYNPPKRFTWFNIGEGKAFPKTYVAALVLAEIDSGGFNDFVRKLTEKVRERVIAALSKAAGDLLPGPLGILIGISVAYVLGKIFDLISNIWKDDVFKPIAVQTTISSFTGRWSGGKTDSPERTVTVKGHGGQYTVTYDWRLFA